MENEQEGIRLETIDSEAEGIVLPNVDGDVETKTTQETETNTTPTTEIDEEKESLKRGVNAERSKRKAADYKYDDAIARLYRSFELIAQIKLLKYGIVSSDIDVSALLEKNVSQDFIDYLEKMREDNKIRIGLTADFLLLNELGDDLGKYYMANENKIKNLTQKRNNSILAHGLDSQSKEDFDNFLAIVVDLALKLDKDMKRFLNETEFAKFDLKLKFNQF